MRIGSRRSGWWRLLAVVAAVLGLLGACGGGDDSGSGADAGADVEATEEEAPADDESAADEDPDEAATAEFDCPVTVADVEEAFTPIQFEEPKNSGGADCTFLREDGIGSLVLMFVGDGGAATYASAQATLVGAKKVDVADEAVYGPAQTKLFFRADDKVVAVQGITLIGVDGIDNLSDDALDVAIEESMIEIAVKAAAGL